MESLEEIMIKYKLTDEEHKRIEKQIIRVMTYNKMPVEHPKAIIDIAPPASGKTGLNGYGIKQFKDNNVIVINSDELKPFHPQITEIAKKYPEHYTKITDQESNTWTSALFDEVLAKGYNVIFEGTGKNTRILDTIKSKMQGYEVIVRGLAVTEQKCLISLLERYILQIQNKGWGRLVRLDHFYETYNAMPETVDAIEKSGVVDAVEIFSRGKNPSEPIKIYDSRQREKTKYPSAKHAVLCGRLEDKQLINEYENKKIIEFLADKIETDEEKNILAKIINLDVHRKEYNEEERKMLDMVK